MKLFDFGDTDTRSWFRQILEWSQRRISLTDNVAVFPLTARVGVAETRIGHKLGKIPSFVVPAFTVPASVDTSNDLTLSGLQMTKPPEENAIYFKKTTEGDVTFLLFA